MSISVVVVTYRRLERLAEILTAWLKETSDVWLCDCSRQGFKTTLPVKIIRAVPDPGNKIRHAVALMTDGDLVIKADDDVIPYAGLAADFIQYHEKLGDAILGIHGRTFHGRNYYMNTKMVGAKALRRPGRVDFVGVITCTSRKFLPFDLQGCNSAIEDLFWQMKCFPTVPKYVIPTDKYHNLAESKDRGRLCGTAETRRPRIKFYEYWYARNYEKRVGC